jgi:glyoxylase-like metal-dependent hydrolase (beta-lactamase superfamily II)
VRQEGRVLLAPGLHRIGSDVVACYLVATDEGVTVVDAGLPGQHAELLVELSRMGRSVADVHGIVLTHGDTDHLGFAERLRRDHGIPVHVHELDADRARGVATPSLGGRQSVRLRPLARFLWYGAREGGLRIPPVTTVATFTDGVTLDLPGHPRIVHLPGHTPGSVAIHVPVVDAVFVGDALTTGHVLTGVRALQPAPFTLDAATALASLDRLAGIDARWVLPGHGPPWDGGTVEAVRRVRLAAACHAGGASCSWRARLGATRGGSSGIFG